MVSSMFSKFGGLSQFLFEEVLGKAPVKMMFGGVSSKIMWSSVKSKPFVEMFVRKKQTHEAHLRS